MKREMFAVALALFAAALAPSRALASISVGPDERSAFASPRLRSLYGAVFVQGAYVAEVGNASNGSAGIVGGKAAWSFAAFARWRLFGRHELVGYRWRNVSILAVGHEVGLRFAPARHLSVEAAFLSHRVRRVEIDGYETSPGGVEDMGTELGVWLPFEPHRRLRLDLHFVSRLFDVYKRAQGVWGAGGRASLLLAANHALFLDLMALCAVRTAPRPGVDAASWKLLAELGWRANWHPSVGTALGARLSTSMLVGEQPMLELKRSMIGEPMGVVYAGVFFSL